MNEENVKSNVVSGLIWRFLERCGAQGVSFVVSIILARLLEPELYGTIALVTVFLTILQVFVDSGMASALIQKKDADDVDFSSVFYFNIVVCSVLYVIMFFIAPFIANFYDNTELTPVIRVMSLILVFSGLKNVQQAYVSRHMLFKRFFYSTLIGTIISAVIGVVMAYLGCGVWALVAQHLSNTAIDTLILWITVKWRPKKLFSFSKLKCLISYGWKLLVSAVLDTVYINVRQLIIGKMYSASDLAYYNRGKQYPNLIITNVNTSIDSVLFPAMSGQQDSVEKVKAMTRRAIKTSSYVMWPLMMGMAFTAEPLIRWMLTDKWIASVPYLRIFCITYAFYPIHTANLNAIKAMGRSDLFLKLEIIKKIMGVSVLLCTMWHGVMAMTYSLLFTNVISQIINSWPNKKLLNYSYLEQLKDIIPSILLSLVMGVVITPILYFGLSSFVTFCIQVIVGAAVYIIGSKLLKYECYEYIIDMIREYISKKREGK